MFKLKWLRFQSVSLHDFICTEHALTSFLIGHRRTLEGLYLQDVRLHKWNTPETEMPLENSILRFIWTIKHTLQLKVFEMSGFIGSASFESWIADPDSPARHFLNKIKHFVCHGGPCPFPDLLEYFVPAAWSRHASAHLDACETSRSTAMTGLSSPRHMPRCKSQELWSIYLKAFRPCRSLNGLIYGLIESSTGMRSP